MEKNIATRNRLIARGELERSLSYSAYSDRWCLVCTESYCTACHISGSNKTSCVIANSKDKEKQIHYLTTSMTDIDNDRKHTHTTAKISPFIYISPHFSDITSRRLRSRSHNDSNNDDTICVSQSPATTATTAAPGPGFAHIFMFLLKCLNSVIASNSHRKQQQLGGR